MSQIINNSRHIKFDGIHNFRDLGGYQSRDGRTVKWGNIYRSGQLFSPSQNDITKIYELQIKTIMDFRSHDEIKERPNYSFQNTNYLHYPAVNDDRIVSDMKSLSRMNRDLMKTFYKDVPINNKTYKKLFRLLLENDNLPIVFHCTAGKDRTGAASALILLALGVDMDTVMKDYLLTNIYLENFTQKILGMYRKELDDNAYNNMKYMLSAQSDFLEITLQHINNIYGDFDTYLENDLGVKKKDRKLLEKMYLE